MARVFPQPASAESSQATVIAQGLLALIGFVAGAAALLIGFLTVTNLWSGQWLDAAGSGACTWVAAYLWYVLQAYFDERSGKVPSRPHTGFALDATLSLVIGATVFLLFGLTVAAFGSGGIRITSSAVLSLIVCLVVGMPLYWYAYTQHRQRGR